MPSSKNKPSRIFLSFRTDDGAAERFTSWIKSSLEQHFGDEVFLDHQSIEGGEPWEAVLERELRNCKLIVVFIGNKKVWLPKSSRRGNGPDWVFREIQTALKEGIPILPVLCAGNSEFPNRDELPKEIQGLTKYQAEKIDTVRPDDYGQLVTLISERLLGGGPDPLRLKEILAQSSIDPLENYPESSVLRRIYLASLGLNRLDQARSVALDGKEKTVVDAAIDHLSEFSGPQLCQYALGLARGLQGNEAAVAQVRKDIRDWLKPWKESDRFPSFNAQLWDEWDVGFFSGNPFQLQVIITDGAGAPRNSG
jgi:hypothetical protein